MGRDASRLNAFARLGDVASCQQIFEGLEQKPRVVWNTMLKAHAIAGDLDGASSHFQAAFEATKEALKSSGDAAGARGGERADLRQAHPVCCRS